MAAEVRSWSECPACEGIGVFHRAWRCESCGESFRNWHVSHGRQVSDTEQVECGPVTPDDEPCPTCAAHWAGVEAAVRERDTLAGALRRMLFHFGSTEPCDDRDAENSDGACVRSAKSALSDYDRARGGKTDGE